MKKFGLIGGTSWHSTVEYYSLINQSVNDRRRGNINPPLRIISLNQHEIHALQQAHDWSRIADIYIQAARELQAADVTGIALCANTPHKIYDRLQAAVPTPVLHIADALGATLAANGWRTAGLIGTRFTMAKDFISGRIREQSGLTMLVPPATDQLEIQKRIYEELSIGVFKADTRRYFLQVIAALADRGAEAAILGCTEFPLLLKTAASPVPFIDSMQCHCAAIVDFILADESK